MAITPVENLRGFVSSRPPLVVFMLCLGLFAIVLLTVANYIQVTELRNPDVSEVCQCSTVVSVVVTIPQIPCIMKSAHSGGHYVIML